MPFLLLMLHNLRNTFFLESVISEEPTLLTFIYLKKGNIHWVVNLGAGEEELGRTI